MGIIRTLITKLSRAAARSRRGGRKTHMPRTLESQAHIYSQPVPVDGALTVPQCYDREKAGGKQLVLAVTTGRSGMKWLHEIFKAHPNAAGGRERNAVPESFYRYAKFNGLPVDAGGVI